MGLPSVLDRDSHTPDVVRLLNAVHRLLQLRRSDQLSFEELRARYTTSTAREREGHC